MSATAAASIAVLTAATDLSAVATTNTHSAPTNTPVQVAMRTSDSFNTHTLTVCTNSYEPLPENDSSSDFADAVGLGRATQHASLR